MMRRQRGPAIPNMKRAGIATIVLLCVTVVSAATRAQSASDSAQQHFDRGAKLYNLGHFQEAIPEFEKAYDLDPSPIFLFNIAQSHRQLGNKERALFFYRRYLEQAPNAGNRDDVERRMKDLEASLQQEAELKQRPPPGVSDRISTGRAPTDTPPPQGGPTTVPETPGTTPPPAGTEPGTTPPAAAPPVPRTARTWAFDVQAGPAFLSMSGDNMVGLPAIFSTRLEAGYGVLFPAGQVRLGVDLGYARLPFTRAGKPDPTLQGTPGTSTFWSVLAAARLLFDVTPVLKIGPGLEAGAIWWAGLDKGNPFTVDGVAASGGAIPLPTIGGEVRGEVTVADGLFLVVAPEVFWSKTTSDGLTGSISSVTRFELMVGIGYSF
jgi:hypothetical protein